MSEASVIPITTRTCKTMADGTLRLQVDIEPTYAQQAFALFGQPDQPGALARLTQEAAQNDLRGNASKGSGQAQSEAQKASTALYGPQAQKLRQSGFFRMPDVWKAIGTDDEFRAWVQRQPSCISGEWSEWLEEKGEGRCIAAHVRRAGESGTGYKAPYACIPLTDKEHTQCQHLAGENALYALWLDLKGHRSIEASDNDAKEFFNRKRIEYVESWAWTALKKQLGFAHWSEVPPYVLLRWADKHDLARHLPPEYRG